MYRKYLKWALVVTLVFNNSRLKPAEKLSSQVRFDNMEWVNDVGAQKFPSGKHMFKVNKYGALGDSITLNTKSIQRAIDECFDNGGGEVVFEKGAYLTGALYLKEGVHLIIDEGVTLLGSQQLEDYPEINTRVAGIEMKWPSALINAIDQENVAVSGKGNIHAQGKPFWDLYWKMRKEEYEPKGLRWIVDYDCKRPRTLLLQNCKNVTIKDITLIQAGFWTVHVLYSSNITIDGIKIKNNIGGHGPSTDGIDIDSSEKILVQNCDIDCNDDNFCLKAGRDADGLRVNRPTRFVVIKNCFSRKGGGMVTIGSETSGGISHILAMNMKANGTSTGIRLKSAKTRGGVIEKIYFQDIRLDSVNNPFIVTLDWNPAYSYTNLPDGYHIDSLPGHWKVMLQQVEPPEKGIPFFKDIYVNNLTAKNSRVGILAVGLENSILENFNLKNCVIECIKPGKLEYAENWLFENVSLLSIKNEQIRLEHTRNINWVEND